MSNSFWMDGHSITSVTSIETPPRGVRGRRIRIRSRIRIRKSVSGRSKGGGPPPGSVSLGSGSGFVVAKDKSVVTNFQIVERA